MLSPLTNHLSNLLRAIDEIVHRRTIAESDVRDAFACAKIPHTSGIDIEDYDQESVPVMDSDVSEHRI